MRKSRKTWVKADKSKEIYQVSLWEYEQILNKITEFNRIDNDNTPALINSDTEFVSNLQIVDRLGKLKEKCAYILFKDHKHNFQDRKQTRLINPTEIELSLVSKDLIAENYV